MHMSLKMYGIPLVYPRTNLLVLSMFIGFILPFPKTPPTWEGPKVILLSFPELHGILLLFHHMSRLHLPWRVGYLEELREYNP